MATVTPVADEEGNIIDFEVDSGLGGGIAGNYEDYYQDSEYQMHHRYEDGEDEDEENFWDTGDGHIAQGYWNLAGGEEQYVSILQWAAENWDPELVDRFDDSIENEDWAQFEDLYSILLEQYQQAGPGTGYQDYDQEYVSDDDEGEEEIDLDDEDQLSQYLGQANQIFFDQEPQGEEWSEELMDIVEQANQNGDVAVANLAAGMAAFHAGEVDLIDVYEYMMANHSSAEYVQAFTDLFDV